MLRTKFPLAKRKKKQIRPTYLAWNRIKNTLALNKNVYQGLNNNGLWWESDNKAKMFFLKVDEKKKTVASYLPNVKSA